ncbi:16S rRNA m(7)G-527 methyltransferase [Desulforamulus reducens MI-1]|uniref:Ribosomal RNA small subunit methyltransferase G n=1 Tax=Desulforamulus reducens (strain ATCC BAA-1160 / DSM 100696 / MI-1) TaxID=349161 RepID=RSMG_DESRM|nr:16S rRNA (guanine(527)-N(7))-methyltransferase RsmG [Desulforamulus reducens]A4J9R9.1 RecName: Full=Ribosomal RNA small subunit methyltransferase G; AltName: Full=16S rRNA 7-methylguanosine methyltransferase; Short=16S rRNA m7G methyltransferase [Desulforamulus reducens MI-1]ABO51822.1 16S rRNA m(7)G-527 methyltransferase [Desulforamulus reducens MI-1]
MNDLTITLKQAAKEMEFDLTENQTLAFEKYYNLLIEWNKNINLTAIIEPKEVALKHFIDSLTCLKILEIPCQANVLDIGTGAGFPGIPIKIFRPDINVTLMDSLNKRVNFLNEVIKKLGLTNICAIHDRAEDFGQKKEHREKYDYVLSRAVAKLKVLSEYCLPCTKLDGYFISQKGPDIDEEVKEASKAIEVLGGSLLNIHKLQLPFINDGRSLVVIKKVKQTPSVYPRKAGIPAKKPIA